MTTELSGPVIVTKYLGPTNHRGSRIKATHHRDSETVWSKTVSYKYDLEPGANHRAAAQALIDSWPMGTATIAARGFDHNFDYYFVSFSD